MNLFLPVSVSRASSSGAFWYSYNIEEVIMAPKNGNTNTLLALVVGALAGASIALLLAPQSGEKTRRDIRRLGKKALDKTQSIREDLSNSIEDFADGVWEKVQEVLDRGREWTQKSVSDLERALEAGKKLIHNEIDKIRG
jgi:gas vesicle protein